MLDDVLRHDVLILPGHPAFRLAQQGVEALVRYLGVSQFLVVREQVAGDGWNELYFAPDMYAHHLFIERRAPEFPALEEAVLRWGTVSCPVPFGPREGEPTFVYLELVGALFPRPSDEFMGRLQQMLYLRPASAARDYTPLERPAPGPGGPIERRTAHRAAVRVEDVDKLY